MPYEKNTLAADILDSLKIALPTAVAEAEKYQSELADIAQIAASFGLAAGLGDVRAKDILNHLKARTMLVGASIANDEATVASDTVWRIVEALARFAGLAVKVMV